MSDDTVDVLIVGAGASGAAFAWSLLGSRMRILCLEQGPMITDAAYPSRNPDYELSRYAEFSCDPNVRGLPQDYPINAEASPITPVNFNAVGGSTINFAAHWPRMHPSDFRARSLDGVADDWPVDYATLEPYYAQNDRNMGSSGLAGNPAYPPYEPPLPPLPLGKLGWTLAQGFNRLGWHWWPSDAAILSRDYDGRAKCVNAGTCDLGCATGAKASVNTTYWPVLLRAGVELRTDCRVPLQALSGVDIALWDIAGKVAGMPIHKLIGGAHRQSVPVYGYGMMLRREDAASLAARFADEAAEIKAMGFVAAKMKVGLGPQHDVVLAEAVRRGVGDDFDFMVDANHCYTAADAFHVGRALDELGAFWFEEPVAPEDLDGYAALRAGLRVNIAGGEAEFSRWGWRTLLESRGLDIAQPEVCSLGGISEYLRVLALCHAHFTPVVNHVWGSAIAVAANLQLLAAMPPLPGGLHPREPMLEFDTTENRFRDDLLTRPLNIQEQVARNGGRAAIPGGPGLGVELDRDFLRHYAA